MFVKYRQNFSSSRGKWQYAEYPDGWNLDEIRRDLGDEYNWSEHYRGADVDRIDRPPNEWLVEELTRTECKVINLADKIRRYRELLEE